MFDKLIKWSLEQRVLVLSITVLIIAFAMTTLSRLSIDVFPDITAPTVTILTESHGMAPDEVEKLVTFQIETSVNGANGVRRIRSSSATGISIVWVEFDWDTEIHRARQIVNEKLQIAKPLLPEDANNPVIAPMSSIMGEIMLLGLSSENQTYSPMDLRTLADWTVRPQLMSINGVSQVIPIGGEVKQFQVLLNQNDLAYHRLNVEEIVEAIEQSSGNASGARFKDSGQEYTIRGIGRVADVNDIGLTFIKYAGETPILLKDVADIQIGPAIKLGDASSNANPSVIMSVLKQPNINTIELMKDIDATLDQIQKSLPETVKINTEIFRQDEFITTSINNVTEALYLGVILVIIVLIVFLANIRTIIISLLSIPISLSVTIFVFDWFDFSINTMTLGGIAIAIGALVDDAIIDVENVFRRLKENNLRPDEEKKSVLSVIFNASKEIRSAMVNATLIIMVVFLPLFFLSGVEGRLLQPMGYAYLTSISASLFVAVMVTPALCYYLIPNVLDKTGDENSFVRFIKLKYAKLIEKSLLKNKLIIILTAIVLISSIAVLPFLGRAFLPTFNEGSFTINLTTAVGTSLEESNKIGLLAEKVLLDNEHVISVGRRTGRSEMDEHAQSVNSSELDVKVNLDNIHKDELIPQLRQALAVLPGTNVTVGQPLGHRIDHMLSGTKANIAIKVFGSELQKLQEIAEEIKKKVESVDGAADVNVEEQNYSSQLNIVFNRKMLAMYGLKAKELAHFIDLAYMGETVEKVYEGEKSFDLVVKLNKDNMKDLEAIRNTWIDTETGHKILLRQVADIQIDQGAHTISRENVKRKMVVQANVDDRDLRSVVTDIQTLIGNEVQLPFGYFIEYGGQFESEEQASRTILILSIVSIFAIILILFHQFKNIQITMFIMLNLPLALIGGIWSIFITDKIISIASLVGFITLFGIATRNGILLISHYQYLLDEGKSFKETIIQGSIERLNPILMTALTAMFALIPLAMGLGETGKEIEAPMAIVILGGLFSATMLNMIVIPSLYYNYFKKKV